MFDLYINNNRGLLNQPCSLVKQPQRGIARSHDPSNLIFHRTHEVEQGINYVLK